MSNPSCVRCQKTVYEMEKLQCLDKVYHKACFKCTTCNTSLNLRSFCAYKKEPFCKAHYPKDKHTVVLDSPEYLTAVQNSKMQSQLNYHADHEKMKGKSGLEKAAGAAE